MPTHSAYWKQFQYHNAIGGSEYGKSIPKLSEKVFAVLYLHFKDMRDKYSQKLNNGFIFVVNTLYKKYIYPS